jgi:hypothetical protein
MTHKTIAEELKADPSGNIAIRVFNDFIWCSVDYDDPDYYKLLGWTDRFTGNDPDLEEQMDYPLAYEEAIRLAITALDEGNSAKARWLLGRACKNPRRRGAPLKQNIPAIKTLIYKTFLRWSWPKLLNHFCPCGSLAHTSNSNCYQTLRKKVQKLEVALKKYQSEFTVEKMEKNNRLIYPQ